MFSLLTGLKFYGQCSHSLSFPPVGAEEDMFNRPKTTPNTGGRSQRTAREMMFSGGHSGTGRNDGGSPTTDPEEFLARMRATKAHEARDKAKAEVDALQGYNVYSRPKVSVTQPLRSCLLDPRINNIPKSNTRSELQRKIKATNIPHHSFDIDGDGYVSQEDLLLGKRFDLDGNGVLDPDEQEVGRRIIAEEFFKAHRHDLQLYGEEYQNKSENENIDRVAKAHTFTKIMNGLKEKEKHYRDRGSYNMTECLTVWNKDLVKNNFYADKFDVTAWNDFGAEPRPKVSPPCFWGGRGAGGGVGIAVSHTAKTQSIDTPCYTYTPLMHAC